MDEADPICSLSAYLESLGSEAGIVPGIPLWLSGGAVVAILVLSHVLVSCRSLPTLNPSGWWFFRWRFDWLTKLARWPAFPLFVQSVSLVAFLLVIGAGLFGHEQNSIGPVLTWTWWWALLIFLILGFGNAFCMVCPWEAISSLVTSLSLRSRVKQLCFDVSWPRWARNVLPATVLFIVLTWFELGWNVTHSASMTAIMALVMVGLAVILALVFEKRAFCRYVCLVGRVSGIYSLFSPVELRPESADVCRSCVSKACYHGTEMTAPCPTNLFPGNLKENNYCTLCTECVRSCPHENLAFRTRPFAADLLKKDRLIWDESVLAIVLLALTSFHGFTMTPLWGRINQWLRVQSGLAAEAIFTLLMVLLLVLTFVLFGTAAKAAFIWNRRQGASVARILKAYAYALIPVALFYHLAHNSMHFFLEAGAIVPLLSDPFGKGWDLFGTAGVSLGPILSLHWIWWLQIILIVIGHVFGVLVADRTIGRIYQQSSSRTRPLFILLLVMVGYSCLSVWLISQPMDMKTAF